MTSTNVDGCLGARSEQRRKRQRPSTPKTGSLGRPWVPLEEARPPAVTDVYAYWATPPPALSPRCAYWLRQIHAGWLPNRAWRRDSRDGRALRYGVWLWEYENVLLPAELDARVRARMSRFIETMSRRFDLMVETTLQVESER